MKKYPYLVLRDGLNTDYKTYSRVEAEKIVKVAHKETQRRFGRLISRYSIKKYI